MLQCVVRECVLPAWTIITCTCTCTCSSGFSTNLKKATFEIFNVLDFKNNLTIQKNNVHVGTMYTLPLKLPIMHVPLDSTGS